MGTGAFDPIAVPLDDRLGEYGRRGTAADLVGKIEVERTLEHHAEAGALVTMGGESQMGRKPRLGHPETVHLDGPETRAPHGDRHALQFYRARSFHSALEGR